MKIFIIEIFKLQQSTVTNKLILAHMKPKDLANKFPQADFA
jgi:hypothetical protein